MFSWVGVIRRFRICSAYHCSVLNLPQTTKRPKDSPIWAKLRPWPSPIICQTSDNPEASRIVVEPTLAHAGCGSAGNRLDSRPPLHAGTGLRRSLLADLPRPHERPPLEHGTVQVRIGHVADPLGPGGHAKPEFELVCRTLGEISQRGMPSKAHPILESLRCGERCSNICCITMKSGTSRPGKSHIVSFSDEGKKERGSRAVPGTTGRPAEILRARGSLRVVLASSFRPRDSTCLEVSLWY